MASVMNLAGYVAVGRGHQQGDVFTMISVHILGMYGLMLIVGDVVDRFGRRRCLVAGLTLMTLSNVALGWLGRRGRHEPRPARARTRLEPLVRRRHDGARGAHRPVRAGPPRRLHRRSRELHGGRAAPSSAGSSTAARARWRSRLAAAALAAAPALWLAIRPVPPLVAARDGLARPVFRYNAAPADAWSAAFLSMKTYTAKPGEITRDWYVVDAEGLTLGRLATQIADTLRGKRKPQYTPHVDTGDFVVVVNAEKIVVTGNKLDQKRYYRHSGYPGGLKSRTLREQLDRRPTEVIRTAVKGMLPRNRLARQQLTKLKVYAGPEHPHGPQNPQPLNLEQ